MPGRQITPHFNEDELRCHCGCGRMEFTDAAVWRLERVRVRYGKPLRVNSGYRCPEHNARVSSTGLDGPHTQTADDNITVDLDVRGRDAYRVLAIAFSEGFAGIGVSQKGTTRFIHLDRLMDGPRPWVWSY